MFFSKKYPNIGVFLKLQLQLNGFLLRVISAVWFLGVQQRHLWCVWCHFLHAVQSAERAILVLVGQEVVVIPHAAAAPHFLLSCHVLWNKKCGRLKKSRPTAQTFYNGCKGTNLFSFHKTTREKFTQNIVNEPRAVACLLEVWHDVVVEVHG